MRFEPRNLRNQYGIGLCLLCAFLLAGALLSGARVLHRKTPILPATIADESIPVDPPDPVPVEPEATPAVTYSAPASLPSPAVAAPTPPSPPAPAVKKAAKGAKKPNAGKAAKTPKKAKPPSAHNSTNS
jgi:hypothetical protein